MASTTYEKQIFEGLVKFPIVQSPRANSFQNNELQYSIEVECSEERLAELKAKGLSTWTKLKIDKDSGKLYIRLMAKALDNAGKQNKIVVVDKDNDPITALIGNGSMARVNASFISGGAAKPCLRLRGVKVLDLVEYIPKQQADMFDDSEDGEII